MAEIQDNSISPKNVDLISEKFQVNNLKMATAMLQAYSMRNQPPMVFITNNGKGLNVLAMCIIKSSATKKVGITSVIQKL